MPTTALVAIQEADHAASAASFLDLARDALRRFDGDAASAREHLVAALLGDEALLRAVVDDVVSNAVEQQVRQVARSDRHSLIRRLDRSGATRESVVALGCGVAHSILDMTLPGGGRLRDVGRDELRREAERYAAQARGNARMARFLTVIAEAVPVGRKVGQVVTEARAHALWIEVA